MFIRVKTTPNSPRKSVQIVESYRKQDKICQRIVRYVGIALDEQEEQKLKDLAAEIIVKLEKEKYETAAQQDLFGNITIEEIQNDVKKRAGRPKRKNVEDILPPSQVSLDCIVEKARIVEGIHEVAGKVYDDIYPNIIENKKQNEILKDMVLSRVANPCSKHKSQKILLEQFNIQYDLDAMYRVMDKVHEKIDAIKNFTFLKTKSLFPEGVNLLLFDVTTLYFESTTVDDLRNFGYSKDHRFNTTQLVLALATNAAGLPVGYELFQGNKAEVSTLIESITAWKNIFKIESVCFVGDRAMMSKNNMELLEKHGFQYIIAAKLRTLNSDLKKQLLDENNYQPTIMANELAWIGEFPSEKQKIIVSYKTRRALKDSKDREIILEKINKKISGNANTKKLITNHGVKKYTKTTNSITSLDHTKILEDAQWDGLHGVITNITDPAQSPESIIAKYAALWKIEESFRINKHTLKMRPIFHWKSERIKAHIAICYMAFSTLRHLEYQVSLCQKVSIETILDELLRVQSSIHMHKTTKDLYKLPGVFSNTAKKIYRAFNLERHLDASIYFPK